MTERFQQRKEAILSRVDKSSIGKWDEKIKKLCNKINAKENYCTTSSCSGRILIMVDQEKKGAGLFVIISHDILKEKNILKNLDLKKNLKFKSEPPILHIACRELKDAERILKKIRDAGWKRSGIISLEKNITVELIGTDKLEFPLTKNGKILVDKNFLGIVIEKANKNLKKGWKKIEKLEKII